MLATATRSNLAAVRADFAAANVYERLGRVTTERDTLLRYLNAALEGGSATMLRAYAAWLAQLHDLDYPALRAGEVDDE